MMTWAYPSGLVGQPGEVEHCTQGTPLLLPRHHPQLLVISPSHIKLPAGALASLTMSAWNTTAAEYREATATAVTEALTAQGRKMRFLGISDFGPGADPQAVAQWHDDETGLRFSLVPGGEFCPGYDDHLLRKYEAIYQRLYSFRIRNAEAYEEAELMQCRPEASHLYGSMGLCDLTAKPAALVSPMLIACDPVTCGSTLIRPLVDSRRIRVYGNSVNAWHPIYLEWGEVGPMLRRYGWTLPSSAEMEWAICAGRSALFYWGDEPHRAILAFHSEDQIPEEAGEAAFDELLHSSFEPDRPKVWPWTNRLGLNGVLCESTWCRPDQTPDSLYPLIHRGGASSCFPWQYCGEWELLLTAAESRTTLEGKGGARSSASIRPTLRLVEGSR